MAGERYITWEVIDRLLQLKGLSTEKCASCLAEYQDQDEIDCTWDAGVEVPLGKGRYTDIDCSRAQQLQILKDTRPSV